VPDVATTANDDTNTKINLLFMGTLRLNAVFRAGSGRQGPFAEHAPDAGEPVRCRVDVRHRGGSRGNLPARGK